MQINWFKLDESAKLPTKREEDAGFDIYTTENNVLLMPHQKHQFSTGLAVAPEKGWWMFGCDRGSTGSRGIHTHCGIVDNGYRGEIFICLCNDNDYPVKFTNQIDKIYTTTDFYFDENGKECYGKILYYPINKAIAQLIPMPQPAVESKEITNTAEWEALCNTERGAGKLGASGK